MVADFAGQSLRWRKPVFRKRNYSVRRLLIARAVATDEVAGGVKDLEADLNARLSQVVIEDGAGWRILAHRRFGRPGSVVLLVAAKAIGGWRTEKGRGLLRDLGRHLAERFEVVKNPERTAVRGDDEVVVVDHEIVDGGDGKVQLEWMPSPAIIERYPY